MPMMGSKDFQVVLDVVKNWYKKSFNDRLVNGKFAIEDTDRQFIQYIAGYCSKPQVEWQLRGSSHREYGIRAQVEWQLRGSTHIHYVVLRRIRSADATPCAM